MAGFPTSLSAVSRLSDRFGGGGLAIGDPMEGGFLAGAIVLGTNFYGLVVSDISGQSQDEKYRTTDSNDAGARSSIDGLANTYSVSNSSVWPAFRHCQDYNGGGFSDWYLPSINELVIMLSAQHFIGSAQFNETLYWSSTQASSSTSYYVFVSFDPGIFSNSKVNRYAARPVRRFLIDTVGVPS